MPLLLFGAGQIAEVAYFYFGKVLNQTVLGFVVDDDYVREDSFQGRPVIPSSEVTEKFNPKVHEMFVAMSYSNMNQNRKTKFQQVKTWGYKTCSFVSPKCTNYAASIGENCFILEDNTLQPYSHIGNNVTLWSGNHIGHHSQIKDHCFLASHIVVSGGVVIEERCFIGVNATLRDHVTIGESTLIGAGALILGNTEPNSLYVGTRSVPHSKKSFEVKI